jgi:membrane protein DedA with SNARE-associated domain
VHEITEAVTTWIADYGLYAVFVLSVVDAVLPAASEVVMVYAGAVAIGAFPGQSVTFAGEDIDTTVWAFVAVATAGTVGYVLGSVLGWAIGLYGGRPYLERHGRWLHITPAKLDRAEEWFRRYGNAAVLLARCLPVIRSFISIPAGIAEMPLGRYTVLTSLGSAPWYFGLAAAGLAAGATWERFHEGWRYAEYAIAAFVVIGAAILLVRTRRKRVRRRARERSA